MRTHRCYFSRSGRFVLVLLDIGRLQILFFALTTLFSTPVCSRSIFPLGSIISISICMCPDPLFRRARGWLLCRFSATCRSSGSYAVTVAIGEKRTWLYVGRIRFPWVGGSLIMWVVLLWPGPIFLELLYVICSSGEVRTSFCLSFLILTICYMIAFALLLITPVPYPM